MRFHNIPCLGLVLSATFVAFVCPPAVAKTPLDGVAYGNAIRAWKNGDQRKAEALLEKYCQQYPSSQKLALFRAVCVRSRFKVNPAAQLFIKIVSLEKNNEKSVAQYSLSAQCALAMLAIDSGRSPDSGLKVLRSIVQEKSSDPIPTWLLAIACRTLNRNEEGVAMYRRLLKIAPPGSSLVHQTFANMLDSLGLYEESLKSRRMVARLEPSPWGYDGLANTLSGVKKYDESIQWHKKAIEMAPEVPNYWNNFGITLQATGCRPEAIAAYKKAIELNPEYASPWYNWGVTLNEEKNYREAAEKFAKAVEFAPDKAEYWNWWGNCLYKAGDHNEAYIKFKRSEILGSNDKFTYNFLYILAKELGFSEEEKLYAEKWRSAKP